MTAPTFVCRHCGEENVQSIERAVYWQPVDVAGDDARHPEVTDYGSYEISDSTTIGYACGSCYIEARSLRALVMTQRGFERQPVRRWRVELVRIDGSGADMTRTRLGYRRVRAQTAYLAGQAARIAYNRSHPYPQPSAYVGAVSPKEAAA